MLWVTSWGIICTYFILKVTWATRSNNRSKGHTHLTCSYQGKNEIWIPWEIIYPMTPVSSKYINWLPKYRALKIEGRAYFRQKFENSKAYISGTTGPIELI